MGDPVSKYDAGYVLQIESSGKLLQEMQPCHEEADGRNIQKKMWPATGNDISPQITIFEPLTTLLARESLLRYAENHLISFPSRQGRALL